MLREPWRTRLLFVSVAGNLFAAALIGAHFTMRPDRPPGPPRAAAMMDRMAHDLPPDDAARFRTVMQARLPEIEAARTRMEQARAAMSRAIAQTPYDEAAVRQAMKAWQDAWIAMSNDLGDSMLTAVSGLSPDGRRRLAEAGMRHRP
jgi:uncharacterized membrane protein